MNTPLAALRWELWRKNRWAFALILALVAMSGALDASAIYFDRQLPSDVVIQNVFCLIVCNVICLAIFGQTETDGRGWFGFPPRLFALPVRTRSVVLQLFFGGVVSVILLDSSWLSLLWMTDQPNLPVLYLVLLSAAAMAAFQAIIWTLAPFPKVQTVALLTLVVGFLWCAMVPFDGFTAVLRARWENQLCALFVGIVVSSACMAVWGVDRLRSGGGRYAVAWSELLRLAPRIGLRTRRPFASPSAAQFGVEWRRNGTASLAAYAVLVLPALLLFGWVGLREAPETNREGPFTVLSIFMGIVWAAVAGVFVPRDAAASEVFLSSFTATRPNSTAAIIAAKLKVAAVLIAIAVAVPLAGYLCWRWVGATPELSAADVPGANAEPPVGWFVVGLATLAWNAMIGFLPLWLLGRTRGFPWSFLVVLGFGIAFGQAVSWVKQRPGWWDEASVLLMLVFAVKMGVAFWAFRRALRRGLIASSVVWAYSVVWCLGTFALITAAERLCADTQFPIQLAVPFAALLVPLARIGLAPLALDWNRHR